MIKLFTKKPVWAVVFAAAAIFAVTFVACGDSSTPDPVTHYLVKVPADTPTPANIIGLALALGNDVLITAPEEGADVLELGIGSVTIPLGRTLDLAGHPVTLGASGKIIVLGSLTGLGAKADGSKQITVTSGGAIVGKKSFIDGITSYVSGGASAGYDKDTIAAGALTDPGNAYYFGDYTVTVPTDGTYATGTALPATVKTVIGNVSITSDGGAIAVPVALETVTGSITLDGKHATASVFTVNPTTYLGADVNLITKGTAQLNIGAASKTVYVGGTYTIADSAVSITKGSITSAAAINVTLAYTAASKKFVLAGLALTGADIANTVNVVDNATPAAYDVKGTAIKGDVSGTAAALTIGGTAVVSATGTIDVKSGGSITVSAGGSIDLTAGTITLTKADSNPGTLVLKSAASPGTPAFIKFAASPNAAKVATATTAATGTATSNKQDFVFATTQTFDTLITTSGASVVGSIEKLVAGEAASKDITLKAGAAAGVDGEIKASTTTFKATA